MEETNKPSTTSACHSHNDGFEFHGTELRFSEFCKSGLSLEEETCAKATNLLRETKHFLISNVSAIGNRSLEEAERFWFAFVLYSVKKLCEKKRDDDDRKRLGYNGPTLCQILRSTRLNIMEFFRELPQFVIKAGPIISTAYGADWEKRLEAKELQANFEQLSDLSRHYKRVYRELFLLSDTNSEKQLAVSSDTAYMSVYHRFGWLLFLALRVHAFSRFTDLVTCTNGLVSVLAVLIIHIPMGFRKFSFNDTQLFVKKGDKGVNLLASLCKKYGHGISEDELQKMMEKTNNLITDILKKKPYFASKCKNENLVNLNTDGLIYFDDLMEESSLQSNLNILERNYDEAICYKCELDERIFVHEEDSLLWLGRQYGGDADKTSTKRKFDSMSSPTKSITSPLSPLHSPATHVNGILGGANSKLATTPVSKAMITAKWLQTVISPLPSNPSAQLEQFLMSCDRDVANDMTRRAHIIMEAIFPSALGEIGATRSLQRTNLMDDAWLQQRRLEALKLYYRVLEAMCVAEAQILQATNLTSLLTNERFHRCMLVCSAELILATHKTITMLFPAVLERTGITAFDLSKVIESFIRHEESLPRELRRHLNSLEEQLLESMVWEKGSSMYNSLTVARPALSEEIARLRLLAEPMPSLDAIALRMNLIPGGQTSDLRSPRRPCTECRSVLVERNSFTSPVKDRLLTYGNIKSMLLPPPLQSAFASPTRPNLGGGGETCAETGINIFFSKVNKLAAVRINGMVERLQQSLQHIRENVYRLFQQILVQHTSLFFNRHIDQIILCCFYGIVKVSKVNLTFRQIIYNYRKQPQCKPQVFHAVFVDRSSAHLSVRAGQDNVDIIRFYNEIFVPAAKTLLMEVDSSGTTTKASQDPEVGNNKNGQSPSSPKISPFPSLPDMSPRKVSPSLNVYVSPLRTSKMDALISSSSVSYYACVGESTHAYQSPSKDLTTINNRLNGNRMIRGTLNFDNVDVGLVSDSTVANSLCLQKVSCATLPAAHPKSEQPDP